MLSPEDNELVTRVGPGTPMGEVLRRYWIPALHTSELPEADCPPVRVQLLGEKLVGFRDSEGRIGLVDEFCPHRRASLWFGRNEDIGSALHLSRLEIRRRRQLRRADERARAVLS